MALDRYQTDKILTLECEGEKFSILKSIVRKHSPVMSKAPTTEVIPVIEFNASTLRCMLDFMYEGKYDVKESGSTEGPRSRNIMLILNEAEVRSVDALREAELDNKLAADYYDVPELKQQSNDNILNILENSWSADDIAAAAELAVASTSDTALYAIITTAVADHITELIDREDFIQHTLLAGISIGIIQDLPKKLAASDAKAKTYQR
ncbi:hypothetical protein TSTA_043750 [Talaromyces stipitatus ATCC 10500]|uniref:BTB domain-containing protein n=1 Tax=Talaromyces stipitatus (strain ATCC 10500 / CBS 375.48 / QM 6759 / NRRL 1006) TaxID=441959 RepID=B8MKQ5_TALSN|nr:uncharacterized protein TSTA_043750 [Talaromyces stipitatus ATCC 10500]EED14904.1 hypothetical protein TSTA_043750 [Talaromyces stipitatus ATCC 10500]